MTIKTLPDKCKSMKERPKHHENVQKLPESRLKKAGAFGKFFTAAALATAMTLSPFAVNVGKLVRGKPEIECKKAHAQEAISLADLKKWASETEENRRTGKYGGFSGSDGDVLFNELGIPISHEGWNLITTVVIGNRNGEYANDVTVQFLNKNGKKAAVTFSLDPLAREYKKITGQELKCIRLAVEHGYDPSVGRYISVYLIPADSLTSEIKGGIPIWYYSYFNRTIGGNENSVQFVSMR